MLAVTNTITDAQYHDLLKEATYKRLLLLQQQEREEFIKMQIKTTSGSPTTAVSEVPSCQSDEATDKPVINPTKSTTSMNKTVTKQNEKIEAAISQGTLLPSFRTRLCKYYSSRSPCAHGDRCQFAHGVSELRVEAAIEQSCLPPGFKTRLCNNYLDRGECPHGDCCHFAHGTEELRIEVAIQQGYLPASFKTKLCHFFTVEGVCAHCDRCHFAHGLGELRVEAAISQGVLPLSFKTRLCSFFSARGQCPRGDFCHFAHDLDELRQERVIKVEVSSTTVPFQMQTNGVLQPGEILTGPILPKDLEALKLFSSSSPSATLPLNTSVNPLSQVTMPMPRRSMSILPSQTEVARSVAPLCTMDPWNQMLDFAQQMQEAENLTTGGAGRGAVSVDLQAGQRPGPLGLPSGISVGGRVSQQNFPTPTAEQQQTGSMGVRHQVDPNRRTWDGGDTIEKMILSSSIWSVQPTVNSVSSAAPVSQSNSATTQIASQSPSSTSSSPDLPGQHAYGSTTSCSSSSSSQPSSPVSSFTTDTSKLSPFAPAQAKTSSLFAPHPSHPPVTVRNNRTSAPVCTVTEGQVSDFSALPMQAPQQPFPSALYQPFPHPGAAMQRNSSDSMQTCLSRQSLEAQQMYLNAMGRMSTEQQRNGNGASLDMGGYGSLGWGQQRQQRHSFGNDFHNQKASLDSIRNHPSMDQIGGFQNSYSLFGPPMTHQSGANRQARMSFDHVLIPRGNVPAAQAPSAGRRGLDFGDNHKESEFMGMMDAEMCSILRGLQLNGQA